jgi:5'-nucleotidase
MKRIGIAVAMTAVLAMVPAAALANGRHHHGHGHHHGKKDTKVQLLAINDFHGNLQPPSGSSGTIPTGVGTTALAGGSEYLATWMDRLRQNSRHNLAVGAGDLIGGSPLISGLFHDEPAIESMNAMGLEVSGVGNHEFDEGVAELKRMQNGGCHPVDGCQDGDPFSGAFFQYLAANVFFTRTNKTVLPPYEIERVRDKKLAFIGLTLEGTPLIVTPAGVEGLEFRDEIVTINALVKRLRREQGIRSFVVLVHEGGQQNAPFSKGFMDINACENFSGPIKPIVEALDKDVDVVVSAHTHQPYVCRFKGIVTTSASSFGRLITSINLRIDGRSKDVEAALPRNNIVTRDVPADPAQTQLIAKYNAASAPIANRVVGAIGTDITRTPNAAGESALGDVIADAQLASTAPADFGGAVVAFMNPGGIRGDLTFANSPGGEAPGQITYRELFDVQPFNNVMTVKTMTGDMIYRLLAQQFNQPTPGALRILQVSSGFSYSYSWDGQTGTITPGSVTINGVPVQPAQTYRVAMNNFLAGGGDGFSVFNEGTDQLGGEIDLDALVRYFMDNSPVARGPQNRITRLG